VRGDGPGLATRARSWERTQGSLLLSCLACEGRNVVRGNRIGRVKGRRATFTSRAPRCAAGRPSCTSPSPETRAADRSISGLQWRAAQPRGGRLPPRPVSRNASFRAAIFQREPQGRGPPPPLERIGGASIQADATSNPRDGPHRSRVRLKDRARARLRDDPLRRPGRNRARENFPRQPRRCLCVQGIFTALDGGLDTDAGLHHGSRGKDLPTWTARLP